MSEHRAVRLVPLHGPRKPLQTAPLPFAKHSPNHYARQATRIPGSLGRVALCGWRRRTARVPALAPYVPEGSRRGLPALAPHGRRWRRRRRRGWGRAPQRWHRPRLYLSVFARQGGFRRALLALHDGLCSAALSSGSAMRARVYGSFVIIRSPLALFPRWLATDFWGSGDGDGVRLRGRRQVATRRRPFKRAPRHMRVPSHTHACRAHTHACHAHTHACHTHTHACHTLTHVRIEHVRIECQPISSMSASTSTGVARTLTTCCSLGGCMRQNPSKLTDTLSTPMGPLSGRDPCPCPRGPSLAFMASRSALASAVASSSRSLNSPQLASAEPPRMMKASMLLMATFLQPHGPHLTPNVLQMRVMVLLACYCYRQ